MKKNQRMIQVIAHIIMIVISVLCLFPLLLMLMGSFTDEAVLKINGYTLFPEKFSLAAYRYILTSAATVFRAYGVSILVTAIGTTLNLCMTVMFAYTLSRPNLPGRNAMAFFLFFTMLFNGGLVSSYITWTEIFHVRDTLIGLIVPNLLLGSFYVIMMRTYFMSSSPEEIIEAARIDGAGEIQVFFYIGIPLGMPGIISSGLLGFLESWNMIEQPQTFLKTKSLWPLSLFLPEIGLKEAGLGFAAALMMLLPALLLFLCGQEYLEQGIAAAAVKE